MRGFNHILNFKLVKNMSIVGGLLTSGLMSFNALAEVQFNKDIRPVLSDKCFHCHGPDEHDRKANLRLDTKEGLLTDLGGYFAIVPGNPEQSEVYKRVVHSDPEERMPPRKMHKDLTEQEKQLFYQWIKEGASYQEHWSFEPIAEVTAPEVKNQQWVNTPIDNFVLARLEQENLSPSPKAGKRTLIRRLALDLTGLPPTPEQVETFIADESDNAYENMVDMFLAQASYGEHQATYWLDAARYADTHGLHLDNLRSIWPYRDWVVNAFNQNMPFDQFTIEQLAGDLLPEPTQSQLVATGFVRSNPSTSEGGAIDKEYEAIYAKDRTETLSTVWMGLTTGCAACHDHKFDPISQKEFYQLTAFFRNTTEKAMDGNALDYPPSMFVYSEQDLKTKHHIDSENVRLHKALLNLEQQEKTQLTNWLNDKVKTGQQTGQTPEHLPFVSDKLVFHLPANEGEGNKVNGFSKSVTNKQTNPVVGTVDGKYQWTDGINDGQFGKALAVNKSSMVSFENSSPFGYADRFSVSFWVKAPKDKVDKQVILGQMDVDPEKGWWDWGSKTSGWIVELVNNKSIKLSINGGNSTFVHGAIWNVLTPEKWHHITIMYDGNGSQKSFKYILDGGEVKDAQPRTGDVTAKNLVAFEVNNPFAIGTIQNPYAHKEDRNDKEVKAKTEKTPFIALQDVRVYQGALTHKEQQLIARLPELQQVLASSKQLNESQQKWLASYYASQVDKQGLAYAKTLQQHMEDVSALERKSPLSLIVQEKPNSKPFAHILNRGQYDDEGEKVFSGTLAMLPEVDKTDGLNRLDLAKWLMRDDHPLTARVTINRFWQYIFGRGLVETAGDFGSQGTPPTHPELLDWLANDFKANGWDIKRAIKQMVMSATYQQSSAYTPELLEQDPDNRLYARASRHRLGAEVIRDQALQISGLLVDRVGGEPVKPYQPDGLWKAVAYVDSNTAKFVQDHGDKLYRKSLYTFRKRTASPPGMALFDAPDRESCVVQREQSNTPLQALLLMNDPQFVEAARMMAERVLTASTDDKFTYLIEQSLGRTPDASMLTSLKTTFDSLLEQFSNNDELAKQLLIVGEKPANKTLDPVEHATWTMLASQVFNLDEFITRN